jgi:hypothetical protein
MGRRDTSRSSEVRRRNGVNEQCEQSGTRRNRATSQPIQEENRAVVQEGSALPDRLIYGGGFAAGATGASYRAYRERVRSHLTDLSAGDQANVLSGTAARFFGFENG